MNKSIIHNFIMIAIIPIIMFLGLSLRSYASGVANNTFQIRHSNTSYNDNNRNCTINLSGNPNFYIGKETNSTSYQGDTIYATLKVTTSEGTFDIKSSTTYISSSTSSSNLGFNDLGSITLPGYFINLYVDYSSGIYKGGGITGTEYGTVTSTSMYTTYSGDITAGIQATYDMARISGIGNNSYGSFVNGIFSNDSEYPIINYNSPVYYPFGSNLNNDDNTYFRLSMSIPKSTFTLSSTSFDFIKIDLYSILSNGEVILLDSYFDSPSNFNNISSSNIIFSGNSKSIGVDYPSTGFYFEYTLYGIRDKVISNSNLVYPLVSYTVYNKLPLNVYDTREAEDWQTIEDSEELENFGKTSVSMNEIISDNNDTFNNDFSDYNSNISSVDLTGSSTDANRLTVATRFLFNGFYNGLNDNFKKYIRIVLNIGLAMMVLTVGTRVVSHKGWLHG